MDFSYSTFLLFARIEASSVRPLNTRRRPCTFAGRKNRRGLGLGPIQTHDEIDRTVRGRKPVGLLLRARGILLDIDRQRTVCDSLSFGAASTIEMVSLVAHPARRA